MFRFVCQFNIEGRVTSVNAQLLSDTIYCDEMEFTYTSRAPNITATFAVIWGQSKPLDNPDNIHVLIYRCKEMANNCGMCLSLSEKYQCGWCQVRWGGFTPRNYQWRTHFFASALLRLSGSFERNSCWSNPSQASQPLAQPEAPDWK